MVRYPNGLVAMRGYHVISDGTPAVVDDIIDSKGKKMRYKMLGNAGKELDHNLKACMVAVEKHYDKSIEVVTYQ